MANALYLKGVQRIAHLRDGRRTVWCPGAQLGNHRIVEHGNFSTLINTRVIAYRSGRAAALSRRAISCQTTN